MNFSRLSIPTTWSDNRNMYWILGLVNSAIVMNFHKDIIRNPLLMSVLIGFGCYALWQSKVSILHYANPCLAIVLLSEQFPRIANHSTLLLLLCLGLVVEAVLKIFASQKIQYPCIAYLIRTSMVAIYGYAGFHKLNTDFFNTCTSCVIDINNYTLSHFFAPEYKLTSFGIRFLQIASLALEMIVPFGLLFYHTRKVTFFILLAFHTWLSLAVFADFCTVALVILVLADFDFRKTMNTRLQSAVRLYFAAVVMAVCIRVIGFYWGISRYHLPFIQGCIVGFGLVWLLIPYYRWYTPFAYRFQKQYIFPVSLAFVLLSFWTLKTYLGLGNAGNLTMFSNLVTEKSRNNHLLLDTRKTKIVDFEEDYVHIVYLNNPYIKENFNDYLLPVVEFRYLVSQWKKWKRPIPCILYYRGEKISTDDITQTELARSKWWYKYLGFRKIQRDSPNRCRW